jgi:carbamoyltransferase
MIILGISCFYHDSAATIIKDGQIIAAAQEERFTRIKHDNNFPYKAIEFCLNSLKISINEINYIVFYEKPIIKFDRIITQHIQYFPKSIKAFFKTIPSWMNEKLQIRDILKKKCHYHGKILFIPHHLSHAAASYLTSPFSQASILTIDGVGEWATTTYGFAKGVDIELKKQINFPHSLGLFYSTLTAYLGFLVNNDEYKVMGLSGYGNPKKYYSKIKKLIKIQKDGSFQVNTKYFSYEYKEKMFTKKLCQLLNGPPRQPNAKMTTRFKDIAATTQLIFEETLFNLLNNLHKKYPNKNLVISGGSALNSLANGKILKNTPFQNLYITPDPGDGGSSLGAALYVYHCLLKNPKNNSLPSVYLGPEFDFLQINKVIKQFNLKSTYINNEKKLIDFVSNLLIKQKVIAWFQGRMEWGPRALGNRSILAAATKREMMDIINSKVKHREMFRPFAPVILREKTQDYFITDENLPISSDYMLLVYPFKENMKSKVPAVVHVDDTGRLQTIDKKTNSKYYNLVNSYYQKTGIPIIINTSFNVKGEPIVCTPEDAVKCFLNTKIDYLVIGNYIIKK